MQMQIEEMKKYLDTLKEKFETEDFIKNDPVQFPHLFKNDIKNLEIMGFVASLFAFGKRELFIQKLNLLLKTINYNPYEFLLNYDENKLTGLIYRFYKDTDIKALFYILSEIVKKGMTLGDFFFENKDGTINGTLQNVYNFFSNSKYNPKTQGFSFMIANPKSGGANKRMNMFLRWMVRCGPVDFGIWNFIDKKDLIIPLDVHSANTSRALGLLTRKQNDFKSAWELTQKLKEYCEFDPTGYDFALFGAGVNKENLRVLV